MEDILFQNIEKELGLENMPEEEKNEILLRVSVLVYQNVMLKVVELLTEEEQDEFDKLMNETENDNEAGGKITEFLREKIENFDDIVAEEVRNFKQESVDVMNEINN